MVENLVNDEIPNWNDLDATRQDLFLEALQRGGFDLAELGISAAPETECTKTETPHSQADARGVAQDLVQAYQVSQHRYRRVRGTSRSNGEPAM